MPRSINSDDLRSEGAMRLALKFEQLPSERKRDAVAIVTLSHRNPLLFEELAGRFQGGDLTPDEFAEAARAWLAENPVS